MRFSYRSLLSLVATLASLCAVGRADEFRSFHVGNSLTADTWVTAFPNRPLHDEVGWHIKCASALSNMLANPQSVCADPSSFGYFTQALANNEWDVVTLQPYTGYSNATEIQSFVTMAQMTNDDAEILMYATWPWEADQASGFREEWYADPDAVYEDSGDMVHRRSWYEYALAEVREDLPGRRVNLVPVGDVWAALDRKFEEGAYPGISDAGDLYRDTRHANNVGRYVAQTTMWAVMHKQNPVLYPELQNGFWPSTPGTHGRDIMPTALLGQLVRETVWEVVSNDPLTGIESSPGDFNRDGIVNLADYTVWRDGLGSQFDAADYEVWKANYGMSTGLSTGIAAGSTSAASVPEPASAAIALLAIMTAGAVARKVSRVVPDPGL
ncbi:hypothetical protein [Aeoliella sp. SH292]|uniref:hypothetical protein n=1 Tax=Aeoliella sp. SH292 TaxID=3454464 RepID=UPI003F9DDF6B